MFRSKFVPLMRTVSAANKFRPLFSGPQSVLARPSSKGWKGQSSSGWRETFTGATCGAFAASWGGAGALCFWGSSGEDSKAKEASKSIMEVVKKADEMYDKKEYVALRDFLESKAEDSADPELLWRLARSLYDVADKTAISDKAQKQALVERAMKVIEKALEKGPDNFAVHKWFGIVLNKVGEFQGTKATIQNSFIVKEHWETAGLSTITRSIASAIFASPPSASYQEALQHFLEAEQIQPGFWLKNQLNIAKCCIQVKDNAQARMWLEKIAQASAVSDEDQDVQKEAAALLKKTK